MFNAIKRFITKQQPVDEVRAAYQHTTGDGFDVFLKKMNTYFTDFPGEAVHYANELHYLNNALKQLTPEEKLLYAVMPYPFTRKYHPADNKVYHDTKAGMYYMLLEGKRLYYPETYTDPSAIQQSFMYLSVEQDKESPHRYLDKHFDIVEGDTVLDLGAAEGNFSLLVVEKVKRLVIVEADVKWAAALAKTFEPWQEKVQIINKYAGNVSNETTVTIEAIPGSHEITAIKMDIEGAEMSVLENAASFLSKNNIKLAVAAYHRHTDAANIKMMLEGFGYTTVYSPNYMLFIYDNLQPPYFRRGLVKAQKQVIL